MWKTRSNSIEDFRGRLDRWQKYFLSYMNSTVTNSKVNFAPPSDEHNGASSPKNSFEDIKKKEQKK